MPINTLSLMFAQAAPAGQQPGNPLTFMVPLIVIMAVFMYLQTRSQKKKAQEHQQMLAKMKSGDRVLTNAGIVGTVVAVKDKTVTIRTAGDTKLEFTKASVVEITSGSDSSES